MGDFILKASPDEDLYLIWSTVVDAPTWVFGSSDEIADHLWAEWRRQHPDCSPKPGTGPAARLARADIHGSSMIDPQIGGWGDESLLLGNGTPDDGWWYELPRTNLTAYARALLDQDEAAALVQLRRTTRIDDEDAADGEDTLHDHADYAHRKGERCNHPDRRWVADPVFGSSGEGWWTCPGHAGAAT